MKTKILCLLALSFLFPVLVNCSQRGKKRKKNCKTTISQTYKKVETINNESSKNQLSSSSESNILSTSLASKEHSQEEMVQKKKKIVNPDLSQVYEEKIITSLSKALQKEVDEITRLEEGMFVSYEITKSEEIDELEEKEWPSQYRAVNTNILLASSWCQYKYGPPYDQEHNIILKLLNNYEKNDDPEIIEWKLQKHTGTQRKINRFISESINQSTITLKDIDAEEEKENDENEVQEVEIFIKSFENALDVIKQALQVGEEKDKYPITLWTQPELQRHENIGELLQTKRLELYAVIVTHLEQYMDYVRSSLNSNTIEPITEYIFPKNIKKFAKKLYEIALKVNYVHHDRELNHTKLYQESDCMLEKLSKWVLVSQSHKELRDNSKILEQVLKLNNRRIQFNQKVADLKNDQTDMLSMSIMPQNIMQETDEIKENPENAESTTNETDSKEEISSPSGIRSYIPFY